MSADNLMSDAVMVPREPTDEMIVAGLDAYVDGMGSIGAVWSAMLAASTPVEGWEEPDEQDVLDTISDAIGDSMDLDWAYSIGAKAIVEAFKREGWTVSAPPPPSVSIDKGDHVGDITQMIDGGCSSNEGADS